MNQQQRKALTKLLARVGEIRSALEAVMSEGQDLEDLSSAIDDMASEERDKFDNLSEGLQSSEKGQALEEAADSLDDIKNLLDEAVGSFGELLDKLEEVSGSDIP